MLIAARDNFRKRNFILAHANSSVMWDTSTSYSEPDSWLPFFQQMRFRREGEEQFDRAVAINVLLDDPYLQNAIPFVSCGCITLTRGKNREFLSRSDEMYDAGLGGEIKHTSPFYDTKFTKHNCDEIRNYFLPLDVIESEERVILLIVEPLIELYNGNQEGAAKKIEGFAITIDNIKDPSFVSRISPVQSSF